MTSTVNQSSKVSQSLNLKEELLNVNSVPKTTEKRESYEYLKNIPENEECLILTTQNLKDYKYYQINGKLYKREFTNLTSAKQRLSLESIPDKKILSNGNTYPDTMMQMAIPKKKLLYRSCTSRDASLSAAPGSKCSYISNPSKTKLFHPKSKRPYKMSSCPNFQHMNHNSISPKNTLQKQYLSASETSIGAKSLSSPVSTLTMVSPQISHHSLGLKHFNDSSQFLLSSKYCSQNCHLNSEHVCKSTNENWQSDCNVYGNNDKHDFPTEDSVDGLTWRRLHMSRAKLKATATTSELLSGFAMVAMVELQINEPTNVPEWLFIMFSVCTTVLVAVHIFALMISTYLLPNIDAISKLHSTKLVKESPHERMKGFIELAWAFSTVLGLFLFLVEVAILCWVKFWDFSFRAAMAATIIVTPVLIVFIFFVFHFYRSLVVHKCKSSLTDINELEEIKNKLNNVSTV